MKVNNILRTPARSAAFTPDQLSPGNQPRKKMRPLQDHPHLTKRAPFHKTRKESRWEAWPAAGSGVLDRSCSGCQAFPAVEASNGAH
jgi:hypothetical protein